MWYIEYLLYVLEVLVSQRSPFFLPDSLVRRKNLRSLLLSCGGLHKTILYMNKVYGFSDVIADDEVDGVEGEVAVDAGTLVLRGTSSIRRNHACWPTFT